MKDIKSVVAKFPAHVQEAYDFTNAVYVGALKPITGIVCRKHGEFQQYAAQLRKDGAKCPKCGVEKRIEARSFTQEEFIEKATAVHGGKYDYTKSSYSRMNSKIQVICPKHGEFTISPNKHIYGGQGCPDCGVALRGFRKDVKLSAKLAAKSKIKKHKENFENRARVIHGDIYDYDDAEYIGMRKPITLVCKTHGEFTLLAGKHIHAKNGCPVCSHSVSLAERDIHKFLSSITSAEQRNRSLIKPKEIDIYLPEQKIGIEYCGMYWHSHGDAEDEKTNKLKHFEKYKLCAEQGVRLITIYESEWLKNSKVIKRLLRNAIGKSRGKVMARKCDLRGVSIKEAREFYEKYHPQGGSGNGDHYGLYWKEKLVACMRFTLGGNDRGCGAKNRQWTLSRYATRITVTGGASRLFKAFIKKEQPASVKSFSDNRYFGGGMYEQLGFQLQEDVPPDYQVWSQKLGLLPKPHYQRRVIQKRLDDHGVDEEFDHNSDPRTEKEMTYLMGARRIYDCGKKRWIWTP